MRLLVRKSIVEEYAKEHNEIFILTNNIDEEDIYKSFWNGAVHPRNSKGQFTNKDTVDLTEKEAKCLIKALKKEKYYNYEGIKICKYKYLILKDKTINPDPKEQAKKEAKKQEILNEIEGCKQLQKEGYKKIYLLRNKYTSGKNADTIVTKDKTQFLELKHTESEVTKQYNRSVKQAKNVLITYTGNFSKDSRKILIDAVKDNFNAEDVMIWKPVDENVEYIKKRDN